MNFPSRTSWTVFAGGMPRASYSDKFTVTVMRESGDDNDKHVVFDLSSKVVDFTVVYDGNSPRTLLVLAEEELVAVDLKEDCFLLPHLSPYLSSIHASAVTCMAHVEDVEEDVYERIKKAGEEERKGKFSSNPWPIDGGSVPEGDEPAPRDILLTGHEDGSVKLWSAGGTALSLLATVRTNKLFVGDELDEPREEEEEEEEDEWPPFRKLGTYDPYSDDPRLAVKKVLLCPKTGRMAVGGTAGQVVVMELAEDKADAEKEKVRRRILSNATYGYSTRGRLFGYDVHHMYLAHLG